MGDTMTDVAMQERREQLRPRLVIHMCKREIEHRPAATRHPGAKLRQGDRRQTVLVAHGIGRSAQVGGSVGQGAIQIEQHRRGTIAWPAHGPRRAQSR